MEPDRAVADKAAVDFSWRFEREDEQLTIWRDADANATSLKIEGDVREKTFGFASRREMVMFQIRFEEHLLRTGWRFVAFSPERRVAPDVRAAPDERRRLLAFRQSE